MCRQILKSSPNSTGICMAEVRRQTLLRTCTDNDINVFWKYLKFLILKKTGPKTRIQEKENGVYITKIDFQIKNLCLF